MNPKTPMPFSLEVCLYASAALSAAIILARSSARTRAKQLDAQIEANGHLHYELDGPAEEEIDSA